MATETFTVLADEYTVHKAVGILTDPITGRELGIQQGSGKVYFKDEVIPASEVSPLLIEALDDEDHPSHDYVSARIARSEDAPRQNTAQRLGLPFAGYDEMDEDEIIAALRNLPSATIAAVKQYEKDNDGREKIVNYSVGFGESPGDRNEGIVGSQLDAAGRDASDKAVAKLTTREVGEDSVQVGEGITGTGDPQIPHGSIKENAEDEDDSEADDTEKPAAARRRSRRARPAASKSGGATKKGDGDDS